MGKLFGALVAVLIGGAGSSADWAGPVEVLTGTWGSGPDQFGFEAGDTIAYDAFPSEIIVFLNGDILIGDGRVNRRLKLYGDDGQLKKIILRIEGGKGFAEYWFLGRLEAVTLDGSVWTYKAKEKSYAHYTPTGTLISTSTTRPLELGQCEEKRLGPGKYKVTVKFPDPKDPTKVKEWVIVGSKGAFSRYQLDKDGNLYGVGDTGMARYDATGKEVARLIIPKSQYNTVRPGGGGFEAVIEVGIEYGHAVLDLNGNVYCWVRTPSQYKILKWTWQ